MLCPRCTETRMDRRTLLVGLMTLMAAQVACQQDTSQILRIATLKGTLPPQTVSAFEAALQVSVNLKVDTQSSTLALFQQLQEWHNAAPLTQSQSPLNLFGQANLPPIADWVSLSDYWLQAAIQQELISPLVRDTVPMWSQLPDDWRALLHRNPQGLISDRGSLWATPYRWGCLVMVYAHQSFEHLGWQPTRWQDIWHPDLAGRVSLLAHPRVVLGITLKSLGYSANDEAPANDVKVTEALSNLRRQVKTYTSDDYIQSLIQGDTWLAVGWSTDVRLPLSQYRQLGAVVPNPGTLLSADLWVKPRRQGTSEAASSLSELQGQWLAHWWNPDIEVPLTLFSNGFSPLLLTADKITTELSTDKLLLPSASQLKESEFLVPLSSKLVEDYTELWQQLRRSE